MIDCQKLWKCVTSALMLLPDLTEVSYLYSKGLCESVLMDWLAYSGR